MIDTANIILQKAEFPASHAQPAKFQSFHHDTTRQLANPAAKPHSMDSVNVKNYVYLEQPCNTGTAEKGGPRGPGPPNNFPVID